MWMNALDWGLVAASIVLSFVPALAYARRAGTSTSEFFGSGQAAPWWLIGVSMVATTFSTDTPNLVTNLVRTGGVAANWAWWAFLLTGMSTVFFYARLWRRAGVLTDLELYELRYAGRPARVVRAFRAVYLGLFFNCVIMGTVHLAAAKIANVLLGWPMAQTLLVAGVLNVLFAATSGLWGVLVTDFLQFGIAMAGSFAAAYFALRRLEVGGLDGLVRQLPADVRSMLPSGSHWITLIVLPLAVQWWSAWYPGSEPGGGSYIAQRLLAARSERDAFLGTLLFNVAHYAVRSWPWILVALASMLVFPSLESIQVAMPWVDSKLLGHDMAYPAMLMVLPHGWLGLMIAGLLAAYVSTITTHLNWGSSYLVHDLYRRFLAPDRSDAHYVQVARICTGLLLVCSSGVALVLESASASFELMLSVGAGTGLLYLLRWYWWRINAWSEIAAMIASFVVAAAVMIARRMGMAIGADVGMLLGVGITTVVWVSVTFLTAPVPDEVLDAFYRKVGPAGPGWRTVRARVGIIPREHLGWLGVCWVLGCALVYAALFGSGALLLGEHALIWAVVLVLSAVGLAWAAQKGVQGDVK